MPFELEATSIEPYVEVEAIEYDKMSCAISPWDFDSEVEGLLMGDAACRLLCDLAMKRAVTCGGNVNVADISLEACFGEPLMTIAENSNKTESSLPSNIAPQVN